MYFVPSGDIPEYFHFEVMPEEYLNFAKEDASQDSRKTKINALSNAKRAIDCQVHGVLSIFYANCDKINNKFDFMSRIGLLTPRILKNITMLRNKVEHQFLVPTKEEVADAIDVASLFVESSKHVCSHLTTEWYLFDREGVDIFHGRGLSVVFDSSKHRFIMRFRDDTIETGYKQTYRWNARYADSSNDLFEPFLTLMIRAHVERGVDEAILNAAEAMRKYLVETVKPKYQRI